MRAACYSKLGGSEVLDITELETPEPGPGEVRVHVKASGVNPSDWKARKNGRGGCMSFENIIPHNDGAGVVDVVGEGVDKSIVGKNVWILNAQYNRAFGTAAEYVVLPRNLVFLMAGNTEFLEAACFGVPFLTAYSALTIDGKIYGQNVLIQGGAGCVGHYLIQLAKRLGACVLTTVSSKDKARYAELAGADQVLDYTNKDFSEELLAATDGKGVDRIIEVDLPVNVKNYNTVLRPGGTSVIYGASKPVAEVPSFNLLRREATLKWFTVYQIDDAKREAGVSLLNDMLSEDLLKTTIAKSFPLDQIRAAHDMVEKAAHIGNVVLEL